VIVIGAMDSVDGALLYVVRVLESHSFVVIYKVFEKSGVRRIIHVIRNIHISAYICVFVSLFKVTARLLQDVMRISQT
jgi:hypothetical protein